jgi:molecular chaperone GrpE
VDRVDELAVKEELAAQRDKNLRLAAELQNQQKRAAAREERRRCAMRRRRSRASCWSMLDDFERTLESTETAEDVPALVDGVRIVYEHFLKVLKQHGIEPIEAAGQPFDPTYHEAMMQQPSAEVPAGHVLQELARGYVMHERVLRPSAGDRVQRSGRRWCGGRPVDETA